MRLQRARNPGGEARQEPHSTGCEVALELNFPPELLSADLLELAADHEVAMVRRAKDELAAFAVERLSLYHSVPSPEEPCSAPYPRCCQFIEPVR